MNEALRIDNLTVCYNDVCALKGISLSVAKGEYLGIIGPNGGGKTTFLKAILGLIKPSAGKIELLGKKPGEVKASAGYVPQVSSLEKYFPITVYEVVLMGMMGRRIIPFHKYRSADREYADELLKRVGIYDLKKRQISALSGGEFQKMLIARALAQKPQILLLDEPTASVDATSREYIYSILDELNKNMTIILVTHDLMAVSSYVKKLACLNRTLVYHGETEMNDAVMTQLYGCPVDLIAHGVPHRVLKEHGEVE